MKGPLDKDAPATVSFQRIREVFEAALELATEEQEAFLEKACGGEYALRLEVQGMLAQNSSPALVDRPAWQAFAELLPSPAAVGGVATDFIPSTIARYRVTRLIGQGGMGAVYEAEQEQPRRTVALKIIKPGMASPELVRRFEQETQALGRLQHPGIAQIYEAGTADTGFGPQPYFAMEFIRGRSLVKYATDQRLHAHARLEIIAKVCDAVHHAHQRGLIHRDLKPGNILVDENGQPKIVDFGVARLTDIDAQAAAQTHVGQLIGTLAYMSPEQVSADPLEIDTRSDVYALGVMLYELLAGRLPYNTGNKLPEALSTIREEEPARLSSLNHSYRGDIETIVAKALEKDKARRYSSAAELGADIRRYLTNEPIVARPPSVKYQLQKFARRHTALVAGVAAVFVVLVGGIVASTVQTARANREKDHATAAEQRATQARDLALSAEQTATQARDQAVKAEREATSDRNRAVAAEESARRDRDQAVEQQQRADTEAATAKALNDFLGRDLLGMANPMAQAPTRRPNQPAASTAASSTLNPNLTVREALDRAAASVTGKFDRQPLVEASIHETMAGIYTGLRIYIEAQKQLEMAIALRSRVQGKQHADTLKAEINLASLLDTQSRFREAGDVLEGIVRDARQAFGEDNVDMRAIVSMLIAVYEDQRRFSEAEAFLKDNVIAYDRRALGEDSPITLSNIARLVNLYKNWLPPRYAEAESFLKGVIDQQTRKLGRQNRAVLTCVALLSELYVTQERFKDAEVLLAPLATDALVAKVASGGRKEIEEYPYLPNMMGLLVTVYDKLGKAAQADALLKKLTKITDVAVTTSPGGENPATSLEGMVRMAGEYVEIGRDPDADLLMPRVLESYRSVAGRKDQPPLAARALLLDLADRFLNKGDPGRAQKLYTDLLDIHRSVLGDADPDALKIMAALSNMYINFDMGESADEKMIALFTDLMEIQRQNLGPNNVETWRTLWAISEAYWDRGKSEEAHGQPEQAQRDYQKAEELTTQVVALFSSLPPGASGLPGGGSTSMNMARLASILGNEGKYSRAEEEYTKVLPFQNMPGGEGPATFRKWAIGWTRIHQQKYVEAEAILREACGFLASTGSAQSKQRYNCDSELGASLVGQKKYAEAEPLLVSGYEGMVRTQRQAELIAIRPMSRFTLEEAGDWIVRLYEEWGKPEKAAEWKSKLQAAKLGKLL